MRANVLPICVTRRSIDIICPSNPPRNPKSIPPQPENKDTTVVFASFIAFTFTYLLMLNKLGLPI